MSTRPSADPIGESPACDTRIELCGALRADIGGRPVASLLPGRQGRTLFAFLVANRHRPVSRSELHEVLWPRDLPEAPDTGLSTVLARVRRVVGEGVIEGRAELGLRLEPNAEVDVERALEEAREAERALARDDPEASIAAAEAALEIIDRPLLPGMEGAWIDDLQAELSDLEPGLLEVLARAALALGGDHLAAGERMAARLVERHPFREAGYALLIEIQARRGNPAEATRTFHRLRTFLREELGTAPSAGVSALHERMLRGDADAQPAGDPARSGRVPLPAIGGAHPLTPFVGRTESLDLLRGPWQQAAAGRDRFAVVVGEAGLGKTRLSAQFAAEVHDAGGTVLYGRCDEEPLLAYQPFVEALRHLLAHVDWSGEPEIQAELVELSRLVPEARSGAGGAEPPHREPEAGRYFLFEAVATLLRRAAATGPLLLILDDVHWADRPTVLLLRHLLRRPDPLSGLRAEDRPQTARSGGIGMMPPNGMMVLGLFREVEVDSGDPLARLVADLRRESRFERLRLEGLDERESDALVTACLDAPQSTAFVRGLQARTEGNPFFMQEALRSLVETDAIETGQPASEHALKTVGVPESAADVILHRLRRVPELTADVLTLAAVMGREFDARVAAGLLDVPAERAIEALEEAMSAGLVDEVAGAVDRFAFCHALVREAIYDRLSNSRRIRLHLRAAEALEAEGAGSAELAHHFYLARQVGGAERAIHYAMRAAEEASAALAYEEAAAHLRRALEVLALEEGEDDPRRCDLLLTLGRVQWRAGDDAARETYFEAAADARRRGAWEQLARAALGLGERYWEAKAVDRQYRELLAEALGKLDEEDSPVRARLMARLAENLHFTAEGQYGAELSLEAVRMARRLGHLDTLVTALMGRHVALLHIEHLDERLRLIEEVLTLTRGHRALTAEACHWQLFDLCELGDIEGARRRSADLGALARESKEPLLEHLSTGWEVVFAHLAGDVEQAERLASQSFEFARRAHIGDAGSSLASMLFVLRRQQGRLAELLPAMESVIEQGPSAPQAWSAALALASVEAGDPARGRQLFEHLAAEDFEAIPRDWYWFVTIALLAETCAALGDAPRAEQVYGLLLPYAERSVQVIFAVSFGSVRRQLGMLAAVQDRFDEAEENLLAAIDANERMGAPLMAAEARCEYGALLLRRGGTADAERAAALGALVEETAAPRGLEGLRRRARSLMGTGS